MTTKYSKLTIMYYLYVVSTLPFPGSKMYAAVPIPVLELYFVLIQGSGL